MAEPAAAASELAEPGPDEKAEKLWGDSHELAILGARYMVAVRQGMPDKVSAPSVTLAIMAASVITSDLRCAGGTLESARASFLALLDEALRRG